MSSTWSKQSWRKYPIRQQPDWPDKKRFMEVIDKLKRLPSLVFSGETRKLGSELVGVNQGKNFVLQIGNCSECFSDCHGPKIHNFLRMFLQMAMVLEYKTNKKVIKIGRIAGQYAKPRSSNFELINGEEIPSYRGDIVNEFSPSLKNRTPNPQNLLEGYFRSASTLNLIRAFIQGRYNDIRNLGDWEEHFFTKEILKLNEYKKIANDISNSLENSYKNSLLNRSDDQIYTSHEGLILEFEEAFTRIDTTFGGYYDTSAHLIWVGERTRQLESAHIEFISGIGNPIGIKIGPSYETDEILRLIEKVNPENIEGRLLLISRMGHEKIIEKLKPLVKEIKKQDLKVIWVCDPMHGNTFTYNNYKVRDFNHIVSEIKSFFNICKNEEVVPGGIHMEVTDEKVTECCGGITGISLSDICNNYNTKVDPRLNAAQALEIALIISKLINTLE